MSEPDANEQILKYATEVVERLAKNEPRNEKASEVYSYTNGDEYDCFEDPEDHIDIYEVFIDFIPASGSEKQASLEKIADAAASIGALEAAVKAVTHMKPSKEQKRALEKIIKQHLQAKNVHEAYHICLLTKSPVMRVQLFSLIHDYENVVEYNETCKEAIKEVLVLVDKRSIKRAPALKHIALLLTNLCEMDSALKMIDSSDDLRAKIIVRCKIAEVYAERGKLGLSRRMFSEVFENALNIQSIPSRYWALEKIAETKLRLRDIAGALSIADAVGWDFDRAEFLNYGLELLSETSLFGKYCVMRSYLEEFKYVITRQRILRHIAEVQAHRGDFEDAIETANLIGWDIERVKTLIMISRESMKSGEKDLSKNVFANVLETTVESKHLDMDILLKEIIIEEASLGDLELAYRNSTHLRALYYKVEALAKIGASCTRIKGYADAKKYFEEATRYAGEIFDTHSRINNLIKVALEEAEVGGIQVACTTISAAKELAESINGWASRFDALQKIAVAEAKTGQQDKSRQTFSDAKKILGSEEHLSNLRDFTLNQIEAGFNEDAFCTVKKKLYNKPLELALVAQAFLERGDIANFLSTLNLSPQGMLKEAKMYVLLAQAYPEKAGEIAESLAFNVEDDDLGYLLSQTIESRF